MADEGANSRWPWVIAIGVVLIAIIVVLLTWGKDTIAPPSAQEPSQSQTAAQNSGGATEQPAKGAAPQAGSPGASGGSTKSQQTTGGPSAPPAPEPLPEGAKVVKIVTLPDDNSDSQKPSDLLVTGKIETVEVQGEKSPEAASQAKQTQPGQPAKQVQQTQPGPAGDEAKTAASANPQPEKTIKADPPIKKGAVPLKVKDAKGNVKVVWVNPDGSVSIPQEPQAPAGEQSTGQSVPAKTSGQSAQSGGQQAASAPQTAQGKAQSPKAATDVMPAPGPSGQAQTKAPASNDQAKVKTPVPLSQDQSKAPAASGQVSAEAPSAAAPKILKPQVEWATPKPATRTTTDVPKADAILEARKKPYGIQNSLDVVVRSDEIVELAGVRIPVAELERQMVVERRGEVLERPLDRPAQISAWGLYMVRKGDHLWGVHFHLLSDYLASKGVELAPHADRPLADGHSSGVGKILKFAENMVGVYNIKTGSMHNNLDLIEPGKKVVVYNLTEIFEQLSKIDPHDLSGIEYDGRVLFFPKTKQGIKAPASSENG